MCHNIESISFINLKANNRDSQVNNKGLSNLKINHVSA